ncbi:hypothetical protein PG991_016195 [Apiospora marii]|uniref:Uncharacterized protein n=1 Tax=Apiospora marii TaxID=335849 RepID=A0ABR1R0V9_9PEZI
MQYSTVATLFLAALATASPLAARNEETQFDWWVGKSCATPSSGYRVTGPEHNEPYNVCTPFAQSGQPNPRRGAVTLSSIEEGCELHLYSSLDCNPATGGDFKAEKGECVVMDGPDEALFGAFQVICN